jgi:hypothetical protein
MRLAIVADFHSPIQKLTFLLSGCNRLGLALGFGSHRSRLAFDEVAGTSPRSTCGLSSSLPIPS